MMMLQTVTIHSHVTFRVAASSALMFLKRTSHTTLSPWFSAEEFSVKVELYLLVKSFTISVF